MTPPRTPWWRRLDPMAAVVLSLAGLLLLLFLVYPISRIIVNSFLPTDAPFGWTSLTLEHFARFASSSLYRKALIHSLTVSLARSICCTRPVPSAGWTASTGRPSPLSLKTFSSPVRPMANSPVPTPW